MFHYRILIAAGVLQIVLLLILPALHFLIKPLLTQKKWRFIILAVFWASCTAVWLASMWRISPFSFRTGSALLLTLIYAICTIPLIYLLNIICRFVFRLPERTRHAIMRITALPLFSLWFVWGIWAAYTPRTVYYAATTHKTLAKPIKIALIADLHLGDLMGNRSLKRLNQILQTENPDLILLAGDIIDDTPDEYRRQNMGAELAKIAHQYPVYAVLGNHDNYRGVQAEIEHDMQQAGVILLRDESVLFADKIWLTGRRDKQEKNRLTPQKLISETMRQSNKPLIVIDHQPDKAQDNAVAGFDIQVSGHTHAGQTFPANYLIHLFQPFVYGKYQIDNMQLFITSGYGLWGIPLRIGTRAEVMMIDFRSPER